MSAKSIFISRSEQDHLRSLEYRRILSEYDKTKEQHEQVVQQFSLVSFFSSFLANFIVTPHHVRSEVTPLEIYSGNVCPPIHELGNSVGTPVQLSQYRVADYGSYSWLSLLFDFGRSLYIEGKRLYRKLRKLKSQLKYFFGCCKTHNFLLNHFNNSCMRIRAMMISDKSGEGDLLFNENLKVNIASLVKSHLNGKVRIREFNTQH